MKMVLDKFLWLGFGIMAFGLWVSLVSTTSESVVSTLVAGAPRTSTAESTSISSDGEPISSVSGS